MNPQSPSLPLPSRAETAQRAITLATQRASGDAFFPALVQALAEALGVHYVIAGRLVESDEGEAIQTLAVWGGEALLPNLRYSLRHTPCANVADQTLCVHAAQVQAVYPDDQLLVQLGVESYVGMPMVGAEGQTLGILSAMDKRPLDEGQRLLAISLLTAFAARGAAELQHQEREARLERLVAERTQALRALQQELVERETLTALGSLVAGISHELNTPVGVAVTAISTMEDAANALQRALAGPRVSRSELQDLSLRIGDAARLSLEQLQRVVALIGTFKNLAVDRQDDVQSELELGHYLRQTLDRFEPALRAAGVVSRLEIEAPVHLQTCVGLLAELLGALIRNVLEHGTQGRPQSRMHIHLRQAAGWAEIQLCDDGPGVSADLRRRLFEPFFTTTRGTGSIGLGLPIAYVLARRLGGQLALDREPALPGLGLVLRLPLAP